MLVNPFLFDGTREMSNNLLFPLVPLRLLSMYSNYLMITFQWFVLLALHCTCHLDMWTAIWWFLLHSVRILRVLHQRSCSHAVFVRTCFHLICIKHLHQCLIVWQMVSLTRQQLAMQDSDPEQPTSAFLLKSPSFFLNLHTQVVEHLV